MYGNGRRMISNPIKGLHQTLTRNTRNPGLELTRFSAAAAGRPDRCSFGIPGETSIPPTETMSGPVFAPAPASQRENPADYASAAELQQREQNHSDALVPYPAQARP